MKNRASIKNGTYAAMTNNYTRKKRVLCVPIFWEHVQS